MDTPVTHLLPLTRIRRSRQLPYPGRVLVRPGQKVLATETIAESQGRGKHVLVEVESNPDPQMKDPKNILFNRKVGEFVQRGDIIAAMGDKLDRVVRSPAAGLIVVEEPGRILLELPAKPVRLAAGLSGVVVDVITERGAIIESQGALLQGVWGNGKINQGILRSLARQPDDELMVDQMDLSLRGCVLLGGLCVRGDVFNAAAELMLKGLILGGLASDLIPAANGMDFPVIVLEGFGRKPLDTAAFKILSTNEKRDVSINASSADRYLGGRPEIVIPLPGNATLPPGSAQINKGKMVRVIGTPHSGKVAEITSLQTRKILPETGMRTVAVEVRFDTGEAATIPLANLDVLE